jgi:tRNA_anti-like
MKLLVTGIILLLAGVGIYWYIATEKFADTKDRKAAYTVNALDFIHEFEQNNEAANKKYTDKIITVNGTVSEIEAADTTMNIKFIDTTSGSYAIFAFQEQHLDEAKSVKAGDSISVKGSCSGGVFSRLRKTTFVSFKRCALNK